MKWKSPPAIDHALTDSLHGQKHDHSNAEEWFIPEYPQFLR